MKKILSSLIVSMTFVLFAAAIPLPDGTNARTSEVKQQNGKIVYVRLKEPVEINSPIGKIEVCDSIYFYPDGKVKLMYPQKKGVYDSPAGTLFYLGNDYYANNPLEFYESGCIKKFKSSSPRKGLSTIMKTSIGEVTVGECEVLFYDNWIPYSFKLYNNTDVSLKTGNFKIYSYDQVFFYPDGNIKSFSIKSADSVKINTGDEIYPSSQSEVVFYPDQNIETITSADTMMFNINEKVFFTKSDTKINFTSQGKVKFFVTESVDISVSDMNITLNSNSENFFTAVYEDNSVFIIMPDKYNIQNKIKDCYALYLDKDNNVFSFTGGYDYMKIEKFNKDGSSSFFTADNLSAENLFGYYNFERYSQNFADVPLTTDSNGQPEKCTAVEVLFDKVKDTYTRNLTTVSLKKE